MTAALYASIICVVAGVILAVFGAFMEPGGAQALVMVVLVPCSWLAGLVFFAEHAERRYEREDRDQ